MKHPGQPDLFGKLVETVRTRDCAVDLPDGSWATFRMRPAGNGANSARDVSVGNATARHGFSLTSLLGGRHVLRVTHGPSAVSFIGAKLAEIKSPSVQGARLKRGNFPNLGPPLVGCNSPPTSGRGSVPRERHRRRRLV